MKLIFLFSFLLGSFLPLYSEDITYISANKKKIRETIVNIDKGLCYNYIEGKRTFQVFMLTNKNHKAISFTNITKKRTNFFYLSNKNLVTTNKGKIKVIKSKGLDIIIFPEIQLQDFVKNKELTNTEYVAIRLTDYKPFYAKVKKIPDMITNINNIPHTIVQVNYNKIPSAFVKFVYYFDPNGIASKKEGYFFGARKPQLNLIKQ